MGMKFIKKIASEGKYLVSTLEGRKEHNFTREYMDSVVESFAAMRKNKIKIPAPFSHNGATPDDYDVRSNGGYWENLYTGFAIDPNDPTKKIKELYGVVDVPDAETARKVGTTITEVSPYIRPAYTDGKGNKYKNATMHIAFVDHPIATDQGEFTKLSEDIPSALPDKLSANDPVAAKDDLAIAMSFYMGPLDFAPDADKGHNAGTNKPKKNPVSASSGQGTDASVANAISCLESRGIALPKDTNSDNFLERLVLACYALEHADAQNDDEDMGPVSEKPSPIVMSAINQQTPATTETVFGVGSDSSLKDGFQMALDKDKQIAALTKTVSDQHKASYRSRVTTLIERNVITKQYADEKLIPQIEGFQMSFAENGDVATTPIDHILTALEATPAAQSKTKATEKNGFGTLTGHATAGYQMSGATEMPNANGSETGMTNEQVSNSIMKSAGLAIAN